MKRLIGIVALSCATSGCGIFGINDPVVNQPGVVLRYDHFANMDTGRDGCTVTLVFEDRNGTNRSWDLDCNDALRKMEWLQKGGCYDLPLNVNSKQIPCG